MSLKTSILVLLMIFLSSSLSVIFLLYYMNPETDLMLSFGLMATTLFLSISSFISIFIFFLKKIYYRGDVGLGTMGASIRQSIFLTIGGIMMVIFFMFHIFEPKLVMMVWAALACLEVMVQAID